MTDENSPDVHIPSAPGEDEPDADDLGHLGDEGGPIGLRVGRNPANLGDEVPEEGDVTYPPATERNVEM